MKMETMIQKRFISFLIWQTIQSISIFILTKTFISLFFTTFSFLPSFLTIVSLLSFLFSSLIFSLSLHNLSSPSFRRPASLPELALALLRLIFTSTPPSDAGFISRARGSFGILLLVSATSLSGFIGVVAVAGNCSSRSSSRPPFFSYKMGLPSAFKQALSISAMSFLFSGTAAWLVPHQHIKEPAGTFFVEQLIFYIGSFAVVFSSELVLHLHKVLHTKRFAFSPVKGTMAMETNACEPLLITLKESCPRSLLQYLAYLDLSMVCGSNIDPWRRTAFFEETGETYKQVVTLCLKPLEQLASKIAEGLTSSADNVNKLSHQLSSPNDIRLSSEILEAFGDFQLYAWCAQAVAALEVHSHKEDRFGVAQLSGSHATVLSTLISCLLAVETFMGKKINLQSPSHMSGPAGIKWVTNSTARREIATAMMKKRGSPAHLKSYALADVLKTSIYSIILEFHDEMLSSAKLGLLEDWVSNGKLVYGSGELLVKKLQFFLNFQAS
ncbi:hypothetical protein KSS87_001801 [Heliosperma pusillum]|nr:hypothetical protein KSS87_001801 [Heliosperma pusillum]